MGYKINHSYALSAGQGNNRTASRKYIIVHDTGNDNNKGANSAKNEASYMKQHWNAAYTHFIVDDTAVYQVGEPGYVAWGALNANPYSPMQVELAHVDSKARFLESYKRYIWLIRYYANKYNIPLTLDGAGNGIKSHLWVTNNFGGDHVDPYGYLKKWGISKAQFARDIKNGVGGSSTVSKPKKAEYFTWRPVWLYAKQSVKAYKDVKNVGTGKQVAKTYGAGTKLKTKTLAGKRIQLDNGLWITANKAYVNNLYYTYSSKVKTVQSVRGTNRYKDIALKQKVDNFKAGTKFDIKKVVKYGHTSRLQLGNGMYISGNKLINKFVE